MRNQEQQIVDMKEGKRRVAASVKTSKSACLDFLKQQVLKEHMEKKPPGQSCLSFLVTQAVLAVGYIRWNGFSVKSDIVPLPPQAYR
ncbi:hypothetical protein STEG23_023947 [Scotinomys teguina]